MIPPAFLLAAAATIAPGLWQVRSLAHGASGPTVSVHCFRDVKDWVRPILPPGIVLGCNRPDWDGPGTATCTPSGGLSVIGAASSDRFDLAIRRYGRVAANPLAIAIFHIEGRRISPTCRP